MSQRCRARRAVENRVVFSTCIKAFCHSSGARNAGDRLFYVVGSLTVKLRSFDVLPMSGRAVPVEFDWMQSATSLDQAWPVRYAEVAMIGWSNTADTLPDHKGRLEDHSLTNRQPV